MSRPGEGQEEGREHSPSSLTPVTVREAERSYPRRGYRFLPKGKYRSFTDFFPKREILGPSPCFSFPAKATEKGTKDRFFQAGFFCGPHIFYAPAIIAAGGRPHGGRGIIAPSARIRPEHHPQKNEGKQCRPPVSQPPNRPRRIRTSVRQPPDEKGRPENKPIRLPSGHHPLSARHPRHQSPQQEPIPPGIHAAQSAPQPSPPQSRAQPPERPVNLLEASKSQPPKSQAPPHLRPFSSQAQLHNEEIRVLPKGQKPGSSPARRSCAGVAVQPERPVTAATGSRVLPKGQKPGSSRGSEPAPLRPLQGVLPCLVGFVAPNALQFR